MTKTDLELIRLLRGVNEDDDFVLAVMSYANSEDDRLKVINFIKTGDDIDEETVTVFAIRLSQAHDN